MERLTSVNFPSIRKVYNDFKKQQSRCFLCLEFFSGDKQLCDACIRDLPFNDLACYLCSKPLINSDICGDCLKKDHKTVDRVLSIFLYQYPINRLLIQLKFNHQFIYGNVLGKIMAEHISETLKDSADVDFIIPVPLNNRRLMRRGYNQAQLLAEPISQTLGIPLLMNHCFRIKNTVSQTTLPANLRRKNLTNAFFVSPFVKGKHLAIIDDVITTQSTINELAKSLKHAGAASVQAWCCAIGHN